VFPALANAIRYVYPYVCLCVA